jgi:hypothetical protein
MSTLMRSSLAALLAAALCGCAAVDAQSQCVKNRGWTERDVCADKTRGEFKDYEQRRQEVQEGDAVRKDNQQSRDRGLCFRRGGTGELVCPN